MVDGVQQLSQVEACRVGPKPAVRACVGNGACNKFRRETSQGRSDKGQAAVATNKTSKPHSGTNAVHRPAAAAHHGPAVRSLTFPQEPRQSSPPGLGETLRPPP